MSLKTLNLKWTLAFAGAVVVGAAGVVLVLALVGGGGDDQAVAQPDIPTAIPLATLAPTPTQQVGATVTPVTTGPAVTTYPVRVPTVPPDFTPPEKRPCPEGWRRLSDDEANYSFCLPPGWAILNPNSSEPSTRTTLHFEGPDVLSPEAFPYPYAGSLGEGVRDLMRDSEKNIIWMHLFYIRGDNEQPMSCDAKASGTLGGLPSAACENRFDIPLGTDRAMPDPEGKWERIFVVVPLPGAGVPASYESMPYPTPQGGYSWALAILFEGRSEAIAHYRDTIEQILHTLEGQP